MAATITGQLGLPATRDTLFLHVRRTWTPATGRFLHLHAVGQLLSHRAVNLDPSKNNILGPFSNTHPSPLPLS